MKRIAKAILIGGGIVLTSVHPKPNKCNVVIVSKLWSGDILLKQDEAERWTLTSQLPTEHFGKVYQSSKITYEIKYK